MKKLLKKTWIKRTLLIFTIIVLITGLYIAYIFAYKGNIEPRTALSVTSRDSAVYDFKTFKKKLSFYKKFYKETIAAHSDSKQRGTYIIPGLNGTATLCENEDGYRSICTSMTPQGIAVSNDYLFISAYCHTKKHNSVIYMVDKQSHKFLKELVLPDKSHVGSIAYDEQFENLWVCGGEKDAAQTNALSMKSIHDYEFGDQWKPIKYFHKNNVAEIPRSSFMAYGNSHLYVGYFTTKEDGVIKKYRIQDDGDILKVAFDYQGISDQSGLAVDEANVSRYSQGMAFYENMLFLSHSIGVIPSKLVVFQNGNNIHDFTDQTAIDEITLPNMLEQICIYDDTLYLLFESAAFAYRQLPGIAMDRVVTIDLK